MHDCEEVLFKYRQEGISVPVPAKELNLVKEHHLAFLEYMSDDLKTTKVLEESFMKLLKAINNNLDDLKKLQQKLEQHQKKEQQQKQQQLHKQLEDCIQDLVALETEIKDKLSILGLMPPSSLAEVLKQLKDKALKRASLTEEQL
ncbi:unnamed protein product [Urochloa humidicola]